MIRLKDILTWVLGGGSLVTLIVAKAFGWLRFRNKDSADTDKVRSETAIDLATVSEKRITDEVKISDAALQWTVNLATQLEKANQMIDKKQGENERLHGIIDLMKIDFERSMKELRENFDKRFHDLEREFDLSREAWVKERNDNLFEIARLTKKINGKQ